MFDPGDLNQVHFGGYGQSGTTDSRDHEVSAFVDSLITAGPKAVSAAMATVSHNGRQVLRTYAERMAGVAAQERERRLLLRALVASVVGGLDERRPESQRAMEPIDASAERMGVEITELLSEASAIVGLPRTASMITCLRRTSAKRRAPSVQLAATKYEAKFNPTDPTPTRYRGYGPTQIPNKRDDEITDFVNELVTAGPIAVAKAIAHITQRGRSVLQVYAERMASLAVRTSDRSTLLKATVAIVVGGLDSNRHDSLRVMAAIDDAARRIDVDLSKVFNDAAAIIGQPGTANLMLWLSRKSENRTLKAMRYLTTEDVDGFRYQLG